MRNRVLIVAQFSFVLSCSLSAAPGDLDLSFNVTGAFGPFQFTTGITYPRAMALQPDGRLLVAGYCEKSNANPDTDFCVLRLNRDGTLDPTFTGPSGTAPGLFTLPLGYAVERLVAVRLQSNGKIVLAGTCASSGLNGAFCLARLNTNGSIDTTFSGPGAAASGSFELSFGSGPNGDNMVDMAIQSDDKIVVAGTCRPSSFAQFCIARLNASAGSYDASFDGPDAAGTGVGTGNGRFVRSIVSASNSEVLGALAIQADGAIVLGGVCNDVLCMMRLLGSDGSFDASFDGPSSPDGNGRWAVDLSESSGIIRGIVEVLADGTTNRRLLIAFFNASSGGSFDYALASLTADGNVGNELTGVFFGAGTNFYEGAIRRLTAIPVPDDVTRWIERATPRLVLGIGDNSLLSRITPGFGSGWGSERGRDRLAPGMPLGINATLQQPDGRVLVLGRPTASTLSVTRLQGGPYDCAGDYDGDGVVRATVDSLIGTRIALGMNSAAVIAGITFPAGATRTTWPAIRDYLIESCGVPLTQ